MMQNRQADPPQKEDDCATHGWGSAFTLVKVGSVFSDPLTK